MTKESSAAASLRARLSIGAHALSLGGHDDFNQGQISARLPGRDEFFIKTALTGFDEAQAEDFVLEGVEDDHARSPLAPPELPLHQAVYAARNDVNAVAHSHAPAGLVFGALADHELKPLSHEGALFTNEVSRFSMTSNTVLTREIGDAIASSLSGGMAVFLVNHGTVVVGKSVKHAIVFALMLERACELQLRATMSGLKVTYSSAEDVEAKRNFIFADTSVRSYWEHTVRRIQRLKRVPWES